MNAAASPLIELCDLELDLCADRYGAGRRSREERLEPRELHGLIGLRQIPFVEIQNEEQRLRREELKPSKPFGVIRVELQRAERPAFFERRAAADQNLLLFSQFRRVGFLQIALETLQAAFDNAEVGEDDFVLHLPNVSPGIDGTRRMWHRGIAEHPDDVQERVSIPEWRDVEQRLRARSARRRAGNVRELHRRRHSLARVEERRQFVEPLVRNARNADVRVALAAGARRLLHAREELEERRPA